MKQIIPKRTKEKKTECMTSESYYNRKTNKRRRTTLFSMFEQ